LVAAEEDFLVVGNVLEGARVASVGRAADMGVIEFSGASGEAIAVHIQCPFRILQDGKLLLGSTDMRYPQAGAGAEPFDDFQTVYDARARTLNEILAQLGPSVESALVGMGSSLTVRWDPLFRLEVFPDCSGSMEAWRVLIRGGRHFVFPL
jgi:hypothetical protein